MFGAKSEKSSFNEVVGVKPGKKGKKTQVKALNCAGSSGRKSLEFLSRDERVRVMSVRIWARADNMSLLTNEPPSIQHPVPVSDRQLGAV